LARLRVPRAITTLAAAVPNYLTPEGAKKLSIELDQLMRVERPRIVQEVAEAAAQGDRSENAEYIYGKKRLREIDRRVRFLTKRLESAVIVKPGEVSGDVVRFGAIVELCDENGKTSRYVLVGPDEAEPSSGKLSFQSPLGKALMNKRVGDVVQVRRPMGEIDIEIMKISYDDP
jgi:transcription elongation factor GreB